MDRADVRDVKSWSRLGAFPTVDHGGDQIFPMDGARPSNSENVQNHKSQRYVRECCVEAADHATFIPTSLV